MFGVQATAMNLADFRKEYSGRGLHRSEIHDDPIAQFSAWFAQAVELEVHEPNAMTLATVDATGMPSQRTVLLKRFDARGFTFYTNYHSRKGRELAGNAKASLLFPWLTLERQIIVQGTVEKTSPEESEEYFLARPRESQIGAWVSEQSKVIPGREFLTARLAEFGEKFSDGPVPLPPHWGGYRVIPESIEFWQGGPARLHDRFLYQRDADGWKIERLSP
jgi:pyridoxamine 5'-phosphate oxidase